MRTIRSRRRPFTLLCMVLPVLLPDTAFAERIRPDELLDRIQAAREEPSQVHYTIRTSVQSEFAGQPQERTRFEIVLDFFADHERLAARGKTKNWKGANELEVRTGYFERTWDGERELYFSENPSAGLWTGSTSTDPSKPMHLRSFYTGAELIGVFRGDQQPFYEIVRGARDLKVKTDKKTFAGTPTYRIDATTERGHYTVWVDAALDYHIRRAIVRRGADDLFGNDEKLSKLSWMPKESTEYVLNVDSFDEKDGRVFPTRASITVKSVFHRRGPGGSRSMTSTGEIVIEHADFAPDFESLGAFTLTAPDGTPVFTFDESGRGSPEALWTGDELLFDKTRAEAAWRALNEEMIARIREHPRPQIYDESADGRGLIAAALDAAKEDDKRVLIVWGANWCSWCRSLEEVCANNPLVAALLESEYVEVHIDVGRRDKNLNLGQEYGLDLAKSSIPIATVLDASGGKIAQSNMAGLVVQGPGADFIFSSELIAQFLQRYALTPKRTSAP